MDHITAAGAQFTVSRADREDLLAILALLRDDVLGASREPVDPTPTDTHERAFEAIIADPATTWPSCTMPPATSSEPPT